MKKMLFIVLGTLLIIGCSSPEKKAQKLIKDSLKESMDNPKSYESISFGSLDTAYTIVQLDEKYLAMRKQLDEQDEKFKSLMNEVDFMSPYEKDRSKKKLALLDKAQIHIDSSNVLQAQILQYVESFKPQFEGWKMTHTFRGTNKMGAIIKNTYLFYFDKDLKTVTESYQQDN